MQAFGDEAYDGTSEIYVLGALLVDPATVAAVLASMAAERLQPPRPNRKPFHWRTATVGRRKSFIGTTIVGHNLAVYAVVRERVTAGQQEAAREECMVRLVRELVLAGATELVLDQRDTPGKVYLDNRTMGRLRNAGTMPAQMTHRMAYPANEPLLRVADTVAGLAMAAVAVLDTQYLQPVNTIKICLVV